jgi:heme/copper-type cytochrome/quinol oxidase subunit 2
MIDTIMNLIFIFFNVFIIVAFCAGVFVFGVGVFYKDSEYIHTGCYLLIILIIALIIGLMILGIETMLVQEYKSKYIYEAELKDGSIVEANDCYKKENESVCTVEDGDKKVVVDYWDIKK